MVLGIWRLDRLTGSQPENDWPDEELESYFFSCGSFINIASQEKKTIK